ncbi:MAG: hypothetical protein KAV00_01885 [Phycisphaerae bacterium]|nr:hypothetical protein [Phycisphaerae bacterium]
MTTAQQYNWLETYPPAVRDLAAAQKRVRELEERQVGLLKIRELESGVEQFRYALGCAESRFAELETRNAELVAVREAASRLNSALLMVRVPVSCAGLRAKLADALAAVENDVQP